MCAVFINSLNTAMYCNFDQKYYKCRKTVILLRLFTTSGIGSSKASQVNAESEGVGHEVLL